MKVQLKESCCQTVNDVFYMGGEFVECDAKTALWLVDSIDVADYVEDQSEQKTPVTETEEPDKEEELPGTEEKQEEGTEVGQDGKERRSVTTKKKKSKKKSKKKKEAK